MNNTHVKIHCKFLQNKILLQVQKSLKYNFIIPNLRIVGPFAYRASGGIKMPPLLLLLINNTVKTILLPALSSLSIPHVFRFQDK